ncbi:MAG TPA: glycoside hydrolase family 3 C-terminal domain-containing protein, partial [Ilumatobacteraceae bacterium]
VPDVSGEWRIAIRVVDTATVRVDGEVAVAVERAQHGGSFYGFGSDEVFGTAHLTAGRPVELEIDYPIGGGGGMRGFVVGGRPAAEPDLLDDAVRLAAIADVAVVVVGTNDEWETEGEDRASMSLPGRQDELVHAVVAANPNTVVVVNTGSPVSMPWLDAVPAVLQLWFPGGQLGEALTDVLVGDVEPRGRLPITFPKSLADTPAAPYHPGDGVTAEYGEGLLIGHRWYDAQGIEPLFPFGHGLGYTTFDVEPGCVEGSAESGAVVRCSVQNTGGRPGSEVVQVYVRYAGDHHDVPSLLRFVASRKVDLVPGERAELEIELGTRAFASWLDGTWTVPPGTFHVLVGTSARSTREAGRLHAG